jgi:hypothetical protein
MHKIIIFVFTIQKAWEEVEKCFLEKLKMSQASINPIKTISERTQIIYMKSFSQPMHLTLKFILLALIICMPKQEDLQL